MSFNVDDGPINSDWLRIVARMRVIAAEDPDLTDADVRIVAERAHLASVGATPTDR